MERQFFRPTVIETTNSVGSNVRSKQFLIFLLVVIVIFYSKAIESCQNIFL